MDELGSTINEILSDKETIRNMIKQAKNSYKK